MMGERRARSFDAEISDISRVAENVRAPQQLNLDELLPGDTHGWRKVHVRAYGYVAECLCGWRAPELPSRAQAHARLRQHLGRTPQGNVLIRTLAKRGRGGSGA